MKKCSNCGEHKVESEFSIDKTKKGGLNSQCKLCKRLYIAGKRKAHRGFYDSTLYNELIDYFTRYIERYKSTKVNEKYGPAYLKARDSDLKRLYGLNVNILFFILCMQDNKCPLCGVLFYSSASRSVEPCVDHCHETKVVRGVICQKCNHIIGLLKDRAIVAKNICDYLKRGC